MKSSNNLNMVYDYIVVGGGIIGLSTAYKLKNKSVLVLEKEDQLFYHQSGRNSGVIHSGIYYTPGSLKANNCIQGYKELIEFCDTNNIPYKLPGKLIVATNRYEEEHLHKIYNNGIENGLEGMKILNSEEIKNVEPLCKGTKAIFVKETGIVDYKEVGKKILEILQMNNNEVHFKNKVQKILPGKINTVITSNKTYKARRVIVSCGLDSDNTFGIDGLKIGVRIVPFKGEYYKITNNRNELEYNGTLIYPVPNPKFPFLGVHITPKIDGNIEVGPNALLALNKESYDGKIKWNEFLKILFNYNLIKFGLINLSYAIKEKLNSIFPKLYLLDLNKLFNTQGLTIEKYRCGIRAQAMDSKGNLVDDFKIIKYRNITILCNAPSPAATSSFAIANELINQQNSDTNKL